MANYNSLKEAIRAAVYDNSNEDITGQILQDCLMQIINQSVVQGSLFKGLASPLTNPGTPDGNVFYITGQAGTYVNFGGVVVQDKQLVILTNQTGSWQVLRLVSWADSETPFSCDSFLSADSMNPVENRVLQSVISDLQTRVTTLEQSSTTVLYRHLIKCEIDSQFMGVIDLINNKQSFTNADLLNKKLPIFSPINNLSIGGPSSIFFEEYFIIEISSISSSIMYYAIYRHEKGSGGNTIDWNPQPPYSITTTTFSFTELSTIRLS